MAVPAPRFDIELPVEFCFQDSQKRFLGVSANISETGMLVVSEELTPRDTRLRFDFHSFGGTAEVIWEQGGRRGLDSTRHEIPSSEA